MHGDAVKGDGAYLTKLGPSNSKHEAAKSNFDGVRSNGKIKFKIVFEMKLSKDKVQDHSRELKRDGHLHPGNINFSEVKDIKVHVKTGDKTCKTLESTKK